MTAAERDAVALQGHLLVLLAMEDELRAIGADDTRRASHRTAIAETRARLESLRVGGMRGDVADAIGTADS